jgi:DNA polymerase III subunit epsilon
MGYLPHNETIDSLEEVRKKLQPYPEYEFIRNIIRNYAEQQPAKVIWL